MSREIESALAKEYNKRPDFARFELLAGSHAEGGKKYKRGDKFWSKSDLEKLNQPGAKKFQLLELASEKSTKKAVDEDDSEDEGSLLDEGTADLSAMSMKELKAHAAELEIDVEGLRSKADVIAAIEGWDDEE